MTVAISAQGTNSSSSGNPITDTSLTVNSGDTALIVAVFNESNGADSLPSGVPTWNGVSTTLLTNVSTSNSAYIIGIYGLANPASGNQTLSIPNSARSTFGFYDLSFSGTGTTNGTAFGSTNTAQGTGTSATASVTAASSSDLIFGLIMSVGGSQSLTFTSGSSLFTTGASQVWGAATKSGSGSVSISGTLGQNTLWCELVVDVLAGSGGGGFTPKFRKVLSPIGGRVGSRQAH